MANWLALLKQYIGWQGATSLADKLTAARAALLDQITALRMAELDAANIPADIDTLLLRLPAVLSAARIGYLDNINQAGLLQVTAARAALLDQITAARLSELDAANIPADIDSLMASRLGYIGTVTTYTNTTNFKVSGLTGFGNDYFENWYVYVVWDNAGGGAAPQGQSQPISAYATADGTFTHTAFTTPLAVGDKVLIVPPHIAQMLNLTPARAGYLDNINNANLATIPAISAARIGYLDNINQAGLLQLTAARAGYLDKLPNFEHEVEWSSAPAINQVASVAATDLTVGSIVPTFPTGSTRIRAILIATIHAANQSANTQGVKFKVQGRKDAGGFSDLIDLTAQNALGMVNLVGAADGWSGAADATALVNASGSTYQFKFIVTASNAGAVNYTSSYVLVLVYKI